MPTHALPTQECPHCHEQALVLDKKCSHCGFPIEGSTKDKETFLSKANHTSKRVSEAHSFIKWAVGLLYFIGMLYILIFLRLNIPLTTKLTGVTLGVPYIALGLIASRYKPRIIFLVALGFYLFTELILLRFLPLPITLFNQLWAKIMVVSILIIGSIAAYYSEKMQRKFTNE